MVSWESTANVGASEASDGVADAAAAFAARTLAASRYLDMAVPRYRSVRSSNQRF